MSLTCVITGPSGLTPSRLASRLLEDVRTSGAEPFTDPFSRTAEEMAR